MIPRQRFCIGISGGSVTTLRDFAAAVEHLEMARAMHAVAGPGPELATDCNHLALVLHDLGELDEARTLLERALAMDEQALGADHQNVARDANNFAGVLARYGRAARRRRGPTLGAVHLSGAARSGSSDDAVGRAELADYRVALRCSLASRTQGDGRSRLT